MKRILLTACLALPVFAQVDDALLLKPLGDSWPSYSGDYSGKRYSSLKQITQANVKNLTLAWTMRITPGAAAGGALGPAIVGGESDGSVTLGGGNTIKGSILMVDGTLYVSTPDNAWAIDAHDGRMLWHYFWKTRGATHIAIAGWACMATGCTLRRPTIILCRLTRARDRNAGTRPSQVSTSNISPRLRLSLSAIT